MRRTRPTTGALASSCAHRTCGFTLLELVAVLGVLSVLMGFGIGFLNRGTTDVDAALTAIRAQFRLAGTTAQSESLPTEVVFESGEDGVAGRISARVLRTVGYWPFEAGYRYRPKLLRPALCGERDPHGRFGAAWRAPVDEDGEPRGTMFVVETQGSDSFYVDQGFALRVDVRLEGGGAGVIARFGTCFELRWNDDLVPSGVLTLYSNGQAGERIVLEDNRALPVGRWTTLEWIHDGREVRLIVDGRTAASERAVGRPFTAETTSFELSPADAPIRGLVDDVMFRAYRRSEPQFLPDGVTVRGLGEPIGFDRRGVPLDPRRIELQLADDVRSFDVGVGGALQ